MLGAVTDPGYWVRQVRRTVRFADGVRHLRGQGVSTFVELGPDPVLSAHVESAIPTLRRGRDEVETVLGAVGSAWTRGVDVDWARLLPGGKRIDLPVYPFQRTRYWLTTRSVPSDGVGHPLLDAAVSLASSGDLVLTGRLSVAALPWLADHVVLGRILLPGTAFVELALRAGEQAGFPSVAELTLEAPLVLPERGAVQIQVSVAADHGFEIHARPERGDAPWVRHATGVLAGDGVEPAAVTVPVVGSDAFDVSELYDGLAGLGLSYGPVFRGVRSMWRDGGCVWVDVGLPEGVDGGGFGLHPALLDAALHAVVAGGLVPAGVAVLPFAWSGVALHATGAAGLRVRITAAGPDATSGAVSLTGFDTAGAPVVSVESLVLRPVTAEQLDAAVGAVDAVDDALYVVDWTPVATPEPAGGLRGPQGEASRAGLAGGVGSVMVLPTDLAEVLALVQTIEPPGGLPVVLVSRGAVATGVAEDIADPLAAGAWGLVRSAQAEKPAVFVLVDTDTAFDSGDLLGLLPAIVGLGEPQVAVRDGVLLVPRLVRASSRPLLALPHTRDWHLVPGGGGALDGLTVAETEPAPPGAGQVRVEVRAAGINFRDVLIALGTYPDPRVGLGSEVAGVVTAVGDGIDDVAIGDRVFGLAADGFGPVVVTDRRHVAPIPPGWSFVEAAGVPVVFLTAYYALVDLGRVGAGDTVLVHAAAGGVGMAAVQLAQHLGAGVYGTASPAKWGATGLPTERLSSSRDTAFADTFPAVDVVLNSLTGEFIDASLDLLAPGGRFIEIGKADLRTPDTIRPGVDYRPFDLFDAGPDRIARMLGEIVDLFTAGALHLPKAATSARTCLPSPAHSTPTAPS
jgi:NADPH:quinone reductase-like Zn-dependent oxidoreductase